MSIYALVYDVRSILPSTEEKKRELIRLQKRGKKKLSTKKIFFLVDIPS